MHLLGSTLAQDSHVGADGQEGILADNLWVLHRTDNTNAIEREVSEIQVGPVEVLQEPKVQVSLRHSRLLANVHMRPKRNV